MLSAWFVRLLGLHRLGRRAPATDRPITDRAVLLSFTARFTDELLSGAWTVLGPTFRRAFGLSLVQLGLLSQVLAWVALGVEPFSATMIDVASRRRLMGFGSAAIGLSLLVMGGAPSYGWLVVGFAVYGLGSGPLAHTADVVVVESCPGAPERAFTRATSLDTIGALAGPGLVALLLALGVSWRVGLVGLGCWALAYSTAAWLTPFPAPPRRVQRHQRLVAEVVGGLGRALHNPRTRRPLLVLFGLDIFEAAFVLKYVWLHQTLGLTQAEVALWALLEQGVALPAIVLLDRFLGARRSARALPLVAGALVVLPVLWVLAPGLGSRIVVGVPLTFAQALAWPLAKSDALTAEPSLAGATQAVTTLFPLVPLTLLESGLAQVLGMGPALAALAVVGAAGMLVASLGGGGKDAAAPDS